MKSTKALLYPTPDLAVAIHVPKIAAVIACFLVEMRPVQTRAYALWRMWRTQKIPARKAYVLLESALKASVVARR